MQKKIIALAVAGLMSGAAFAQSNVSIYGVVDAYYGNFKASSNNQKVNAINAGGLSGSRLGFTGTEDLGGGLKALFTLEYSLTNDSTAGQVGTSTTANARQQFVGLTGGFGTAIAGSLQSPGYGASAKFDAHAGGVLSPLGQLTDLNGNSISARDALARFPNAIAYVTPTFNGLKGTAAYSFIGEQNAAPRSTGWTLSADYDNGPIAANFTHVKVKLGGAATTAAAANASLTMVAAANTCGTGTTQVSTVTDSAGNLQKICGSNAVAAANAPTDTQKENALFGSYDFGVAKLIGSYQTKKVSRDTTGVTSNDSRIWDLGAVAPIGAGAVRFSYSKLNDKLATDDDAKAWGLAYTHSLSKRTTAYTGYTHVKYKDVPAGAIGGVTPLNSGKVRAFGAGLNHSF